MLLGCQPGRTQPSTHRIASVKVPVPSIVEKDCHSQNVGQLLRDGAHSARDEDQGIATVSRCDTGSPFHRINVEIPFLVIHPHDVVRAVEVAEPVCRLGRDNCVGSAKEDHPIPTQQDCFLIRHSVVPRLGWLTAHGSSVHQASVSNPDREES